MTRPEDVKWQVNDELEAILYLVKRLEKDVRKSVPRSPEQRKLMAALFRLEDGVQKAREELGK